MWYARIDSTRSHAGFAAIMDTGRPSRRWCRSPFQRIVGLEPRSLTATSGRFAIVTHDQEDFALVAEMVAREGGCIGSVQLENTNRDLEQRLAGLIRAREYGKLAGAIRGLTGFEPRSMAFEFQQAHVILTRDGFWHISPDDRAKPGEAFDRIEAILCRITDPADDT